MKENTLDVTPLKLYQKAFGLHYMERKVGRACEIYEQLIHQFPDSEVSAYASIQLQKIRAGKIARSRRAGQGISAPVLVFMVFNFLAVTATAVFAGMFYMSARHQTSQENLMQQALAMVCSNRDDAALDIIKTAKLQDPENITPFLAAAQIYRKNHNYTQAREEIETWKRLNPENPAFEAEIKSINEEESVYMQKSRKAKETERQKALEEEKRRRESLEEEEKSDSKTKSKAKAQPQPAKVRTKLVVPADSITFF